MITEKTIIKKLELNFSEKLFQKIINYVDEVKEISIENYYVQIALLGKIKNTDIDFIFDFLRFSNRIKKTESQIISTCHLDSKIIFSEFKSYYFNLLVSNKHIYKSLFEDPVITLNEDKVEIIIDSIKLDYRILLNTMNILGLVEFIEESAVVNYYSYAKKLLERPLKKIIKSQKDLDIELEMKKIRGDLAEQFVYDYEIDKLKNSSNKPIRVSIKNVNLGYDIESFSEDGDRMFIEVKSYGNDTKFYWSENEINVSKDLKDNYFIYCVKFKNNKAVGIEKIIKNPYNEIFVKKNFESKLINDYVVFM